MENDVRSRKWLVTINNPVEKGMEHNAIKAQLQLFKNCVYWCMSDEIGKDGGTYHTHIFICCSGAVRFSTLKKRFNGAHFDVCKGTAIDNKNYVFKEGKWSNTEKGWMARRKNGGIVLWSVKGNAMTYRIYMP